MKKKCLFIGSFDPLTIGHLDIIERASKISNHLIVAVANNPGKASSLFSLDERMEMLHRTCSFFPELQITHLSGLAADYAVKHKVNFFIRALRPGFDFSFELAMAAANRTMAGIETLFLASNPSLTHISSTLVREIILAGGDAHEFVPPQVFEFLKERKKH